MICRLAARSPRAIGRSYMGPSLRIFPGARLMVVRVAGIRKPQLERAEKTRS